MIITEEKTEGTLPDNIDEIINLTLKNTALDVLRFWLHSYGIGINFNNTGVYLLPSIKNLESILVKTVKQYYYRNIECDVLTFGLDIEDKRNPFIMGGITISKNFDYFNVDFTLMIPIGKTMESITYREDLEFFALDN